MESHPSYSTPPGHTQPPIDIVPMERDSTPWSEVFVPTPARSLVDPVEMGRDESPWTDLFQGSQEEASAAAPTAPDAAKPGADRHPTQ